MKIRLMAGLAAVVLLVASAGAVRAETAAICGQRVEYTINPPGADVAGEARPFSGKWVGFSMVSFGSNEGEMCIGFIFESFGPRDRIVAKYIWGDTIKIGANGSSSIIKPGANTWIGTLTGNVAHFVSADRKYTYDLRASGVDELRGYFYDPVGRGDVRLRRQ